MNTYRLFKGCAVKVPKTHSAAYGAQRSTLLARREGLLGVRNRISHRLFLPTILLPDFCGYPFVEIQEEAGRVLLPALQLACSSGNLVIFRELLEQMFAVERNLWRNGLCLTDWAGCFGNFEAGRQGSIRLFDFGAITDDFGQARDFVQNETAEKILACRAFLQQHAIGNDATIVYEELAHRHYDTKSFNVSWNGCSDRHDFTHFFGKPLSRHSLVSLRNIRW